MTPEEMGNQARKRMERYDAVVDSGNVYEKGIEFIQSEAQMLAFHTACRSIAFHASRHCAPQEAVHLQQLYAEASFQAMCFSLAYAHQKSEQRRKERNKRKDENE